MPYLSNIFLFLSITMLSTAVVLFISSVFIPKAPSNKLDAIASVLVTLTFMFAVISMLIWLFNTLVLHQVVHNA